MAASTTLKLPERVKRNSFVADALAAEKEVERTGRAYPADEVHRYLRARAAGRKAKRPKPTRL
jgi:hypothetical protein